MKNILFIHHAGGLGGAPRSLFLLLEKVNRSTFSPMILLIRKGPVEDLFKQLNIKILYRKGLRTIHGSTVSPKMTYRILINNFVKAPLSFFRARSVIREINPDIIHLNSSALCIFAWAAKSFNKNIKVVCHIREPLNNSFSASIIRFLCYRHVDQFIAIDQYSASTMRSKAGRMSVVYNPVDLETYNPHYTSNLLQEELSLPAKSVVFLFLARFSDGNGLEVILRLAKAQFSSNPNFVFVLAGYNPKDETSYSISIKEEAKTLSNVHILNYRTDVVDLIASSDVMLIPFTEPHFARAGIEAAAMGKPSIGANIGGVKDCIVHNKTGYLYESFEELNEFCSLLGSDETLRREFSSQAATYARENFDSKVSANKVFNLIKLD